VRPRIGLLTIKTGRMPKGTRILVADEPVATLEKPVPVLPGDTEVVAVTPDGKRHTQTVSLREGADATATVDIAPAPPPQKSFVESDTGHPKYLVEVEAHLAGETLQPNARTSRGAGPGVWANVVVLREGIIPGVDDDIAVGTGLDWIGTSKDANGNVSHFILPIVAQWNFWVIPDLSLFLEPGVSFTFGAGTHFRPGLYAGARFRVWRSIHVIGRLGIPDATLGASILF